MSISKSFIEVAKLFETGAKVPDAIYLKIEKPTFECLQRSGGPNRLDAITRIKVSMIEPTGNELVAECTATDANFADLRGKPVQVRLEFDLTKMSPEQITCVHEAQALLRKAGITFDSGTDINTRDWELDWSLKGPVSVKFVREGGPEEEKQLPCNVEMDCDAKADASQGVCAGEGLSVTSVSLTPNPVAHIKTYDLIIQDHPAAILDDTPDGKGEFYAPGCNVSFSTLGDGFVPVRFEFPCCVHHAVVGKAYLKIVNGKILADLWFSTKEVVDSLGRYAIKGTTYKEIAKHHLNGFRAIIDGTNVAPMNGNAHTSIRVDGVLITYAPTDLRLPALRL